MTRLYKAVVVSLVIALISSLSLFGCGGPVQPTNPEVQSPPQAIEQVTTETLESTPTHELEVVFLDVGQADAALIFQDGHYLLIDGGNRADSQLIYSVLKARGITHLDYIINSHPDEDHVGGLSGALQVADVGQAFSSVTEHNKDAFNNFKNKLDEKGIELTVPETGDTLTFADSTLEFIQPDKDYGDVNDDSLVVMLTYKNTKFLFTGDIGEATEKDLCDSGVDLEADVLKIPHHGSKYSSSYVFLRAVNPVYAVIPVGADNTYGHPTEEALSKYRNQGAELFRTDLHGDVTITSDGTTVTVKTEKTTTKDVYAPNTAYEERVPITPPVREVVPAPTAADHGDIKGNISTKTGEKIYHVPGQRYYDSTVINESQGERWFWTEEEAQAAGWRKSKV
jgi:competence protein ComEC